MLHWSNEWKCKRLQSALVIVFVAWFAFLGIHPVRFERVRAANCRVVQQLPYPFAMPLCVSLSPKLRQPTQTTEQREREGKLETGTTVLPIPGSDLVSIRWTRSIFIATPDRVIEHSGTPPPYLAWA